MSKSGLVVGMILGLLLARATYNTNARELDTTRQTLELERREPEIVIAVPEHPAKRVIERYICDYGSNYCGTEFTDTVTRWADDFGISPYLITAIGVHESSLTYRIGYSCTFGYASCAKRFTTIDLEVFTVVSTLYKYGGSDWYKLSVWHTGSGYDTTGYPERVLQTSHNIRGL